MTVLEKTKEGSASFCVLIFLYCYFIVNGHQFWMVFCLFTRLCWKKMDQRHLHKYRDGRPPDLSGIPDFFFYFCRKKTTWARQVDYIFIGEKNGGMIRHYCRPATHPDLIRISQFFSTNLEVSRFPHSTCENTQFFFVLFRNWKNKKASHVVACPMSPSPQIVG